MRSRSVFSRPARIASRSVAISAAAASRSDGVGTLEVAIDLEQRVLDRVVEPRSFGAGQLVLIATEDGVLEVLHGPCQLGGVRRSPALPRCRALPSRADPGAAPRFRTAMRNPVPPRHFEISAIAAAFLHILVPDTPSQAGSADPPCRLHPGRAAGMPLARHYDLRVGRSRLQPPDERSNRTAMGRPVLDDSDPLDR